MDPFSLWDVGENVGESLCQLEGEEFLVLKLLGDDGEGCDQMFWW